MNSLFDFSSVRSDLLSVNQLIKDTLKEDKHQGLRNISKHILSAPGKQIRPALILITAKATKASLSQARKAAAGTELLHMATLVHDDIMDGSCKRHGIASIHTKWDESIAITYADYLFAAALQIASSTNNPELVKIFSKALSEVSRGQLYQVMQRGNLKLQVSEYREIITLKTASLFAAACKSGGLKTKYVDACYEYGLCVGKLYQLIDDYRDLSATSQQLGKQKALDIFSGELTAPLIEIRKQIGVTKLKNLLTAKDIQQLSALTQLHAKPSLLRQTKQLVKQSEASLASLPKSKYKEVMIRFPSQLQKWCFSI